MVDKLGIVIKKIVVEFDEEIDEFMKERFSGKKCVIIFIEENWEEV